eukprot:snap_masked-scaffold_58-processed-gene-0.61-mRNA-1 protein AED:1.00 eAED:1.00 QI:0/0/0/0/1/1/2/0/87
MKLIQFVDLEHNLSNQVLSEFLFRWFCLPWVNNTIYIDSVTFVYMTLLRRKRKKPLRRFPYLTILNGHKIKDSRAWLSKYNILEQIN